MYCTIRRKLCAGGGQRPFAASLTVATWASDVLGADVWYQKKRRASCVVNKAALMRDDYRLCASRAARQGQSDGDERHNDYEIPFHNISSKLLLFPKAKVEAGLAAKTSEGDARVSMNSSSGLLRTFVILSSTIKVKRFQ